MTLGGLTLTLIDRIGGNDAEGGMIH